MKSKRMHIEILKDLLEYTNEKPRRVGEIMKTQKLSGQMIKPILEKLLNAELMIKHGRRYYKTTDKGRLWILSVQKILEVLNPRSKMVQP